jgi:glycosyltransferase involved in cell wall biosynthesis
VIYTAAHGGFAGQALPLGGGAAVCDMLMEEWGRTKPFELRLLTPAILGPGAPSGRELVSFPEKKYARFCRMFEQAVTDEILREDPAETVVLSNDISEGPDFKRLAQAGFRIHTIYHVDVVAYIAAIYLNGWVRPQTLVRWSRRIWLPDILRLIFDKQRASVAFSSSIIVPSAGMKEVLNGCYPGGAEVHVLPWGCFPAWSKPPASYAGIRAGAEFTLITVSRISPEKGQDLLLQALHGWDGPPLRVIICGEAAFMQGKKFEQKLRKLARGLPVEFAGYVTGERKAALLAQADLYVFPSRHESYGLTLLEALSAGLPAICLDHAGAREVMRPEFGEIVTGEPVSGLRAALRRMLADRDNLRRKGEAARAWAQTRKFEDSARRLAELLV